MRKKLALLGLCVVAALTIVACGSPSEATPTIEPTNKVTNEPTNEPTSEPISEVPSVTPSETPTPTPSEEPTPTPSETPTPTPSEEPTPTPSEEPTPSEIPTPSVVPDNSSNDNGGNNDSEKEETSSSSESVTTPEENSSSSEVIVPPVEDDPTPSNPGWTGDYDNLPSDGFDHIKVPTIDDFYDEGLDNPGGAFDFGNRPEWEGEWYDAYNEFLVANGSPIIDDTPIGAFYAINPGSTFINGATYQYLYYGFRGDATNGWGDIVIYPNGLHPTIKDDSNYKDSYILETTNFFYGEMDKGLENEYRAATTMMLSWIVPNPQEVEKAIYDFHVDTEGDAILTKLVLEHGAGSWVQIGEVDVCVSKVETSSQTIMIAIRAHK